MVIWDIILGLGSHKLLRKNQYTPGKSKLKQSSGDKNWFGKQHAG